MTIQEHANKRIRDNNKTLGVFSLEKKKKVCNKKNMLEELADFYAYAFHGMDVNYKNDREQELIANAIIHAKEAYHSINLLKK